MNRHKLPYIFETSCSILHLRRINQHYINTIIRKSLWNFLKIIDFEKLIMLPRFKQ